MFSRNAGCAACAWLVDGSATTGSRFPIASTRMPSASVSQIPASPLIDGVHRGRGDDHRVRVRQHVRLARVLVLAADRVPGLPFQGAVSVNRRPDGVVSTHTSHPRCWARLTSWPTRAAGGAAHAIT